MLDAGNASASRDGDIAAEVERDGIGVVTPKYLPGARVVRAFNTVNYGILAKEANRPAPRLAIPIAVPAPSFAQSKKWFSPQRRSGKASATTDYEVAIGMFQILTQFNANPTNEPLKARPRR